MKRHLLLYAACFVIFVALLKDARNDEDSGLSPMPSKGNALAMSLQRLSQGENHLCRRDKAGTLWCWGNNLKGQLANPQFALQPVPQAIPFRRPFSMMEGGADHSCGLLTSGQIECWGDPAMGVMGDGNSSAQPDTRPITVPGLSNIVRISSGFDGMCALDAAGKVFCWGAVGRSNSRQRIRVFRTYSRPEPMPLPEPAIHLGFGVHHACAVGASGAAYCWGFNGMGALGDGSVEDRMQPVRVLQLPEKLASITPGYLQTCAIAVSKRIYCWGGNQQNQLGDGLPNPNTDAKRLLPAIVPNLENIVQLRSGSSTTCALDEAGRVFCWGYNEHGSAGQDPARYPNVPVPMPISLQIPVVELAPNEWGMCALTASDRVYCWGSNKTKLLGERTAERSWRPVEISFPKGFAAR
jgi:alpha-tubulin suppressor-like RCC1 family protein